jgi:regulator of nucleoside diphosphate kinase
VLDLARVVRTDAVPDTVVTMNSCVEFEDARSGTKEMISIVYPAEADPASGRVSVLSPVGSALIGASCGAEVELPLPHGATRRMRIVRVVYQPESEERSRVA